MTKQMYIKRNTEFMIDSNKSFGIQSSPRKASIISECDASKQLPPIVLLVTACDKSANFFVSQKCVLCMMTRRVLQGENEGKIRLFHLDFGGRGNS